MQFADILHTSSSFSPDYREVALSFIADSWVDVGYFFQDLFALILPPIGHAELRDIHYLFVDGQ